MRVKCQVLGLGEARETSQCKPTCAGKVKYVVLLILKPGLENSMSIVTPKIMQLNRFTAHTVEVQ